MSDTEPTVTIVTENGPAIITQAQYDIAPKSYELYEAPAPKAQAPVARAEGVEVVQPLAVVKSGKSFVIVDANNVLFNEEKYKTEADAWTATFPVAPAAVAEVQ